MQNQCASRDTISLGRFRKFFKRLYRKKPKSTCQASGCSNPCSKNDKFCGVNCKSNLLPTLPNTETSTIQLTTPVITISAAQTDSPATSSVFTRILKHKKSTESELPDDDDNLSSNSKDNSRKSTKWTFLAPKTVTNSQSSISSRASSDLNDSAYESGLETDSSIKSKKKEKISNIEKTIITELKVGDKDYENIKKMFQVGLPKNNILGIFQLQMPIKLLNDHEAYKNKIADNTNRSKDGITHKMFHGTKHADNCDPRRFINNRKPKFCKSGCGFCGIAQEGNQSKFSNYNGKMWFANNSITSLGYCGSPNIKTMFVVDVIAEKYQGILIVSNNAATIPRYLVIFK
ncbi:11220_t:CDS:2 [Cetraspora pellucida]|uniref:11220_t:CDS:1 n=1 Tax=Cetraspora pellucida TaxID=1433469 RepID=A0ACA9LBR3_9GLOM|nr:11220_t:CDS:2 [Cetraspora pellucida]